MGRLRAHHYHFILWLSQDSALIRSLLLENVVQPVFYLCLIVHMGLMNKENKLGLLEFRCCGKAPVEPQFTPEE